MANKNENILSSFYDDSSYLAISGNEGDVVFAAFGKVGDTPVYSIVQSGEALCAKDLKKMVKAVKLAAQTGFPIVTFYSSVGARLDKGLSTITGYAKLHKTISKVSGVVPQIAVVTGICGGSAAIAAAMSDVCIMSKEGELFLTPPFTSAAAGDKLENAGKAEFAAAAGVAHILVDNAKEAAEKAAKLVSLLPSNNLATPAEYDAADASAALNLVKYTAQNAALSIIDDASEVQLFSHSKAVYIAFAAIDGNAVGVISTEKVQLEHSAVSLITRFIRLCDCFNIPVVTVLNTEGFAKSSSNDIAGGIKSAASLAATYADATTAKLTVITGKAVGIAYSAFSQSDFTIVLEGAVISPIEPSAAATVVYSKELSETKNITQDTIKYTNEYITNFCSSQKLLEQGVADFVVPVAGLRDTAAKAIGILLTKRVSRLAKKYGNAT